MAMRATNITTAGSACSRASRTFSSTCMPAMRGRARAAASRRQVKVMALFSGGPDNNKDKKKFITREEEPEEYWSSKGERAGANPIKDPIAIIGVLAIFFPFIFLLIAIGLGYIDLSVYK